MANKGKASSAAKGKPKDFEKVKHKVGRIKPGAANATDTTVRSKKIHVKEQLKMDNSIMESGDQMRVKVQQHVVKCRHYSHQVRKDAYMSLLRMFKEMSDTDVHRLLANLSEAISKAFIDEDEAVRSVAMSLSQFLMKRVQEGVLAAYFPGWMQFCLLSLTHIEPAIRRDGLLFIASALESKPHLMVSYHVKVLQNAIPGLTPRSSRPLKKGAGSETDLVLRIIRLYSDAASKPVDTMVYPDYTWSHVQSRQLRIVRPVPKTTGLEPIDPAFLKILVAKTLESLSDAWLLLSDQVNSNQQVKNDETLLIREAIFAIRRLVQSLDSDEEECFWRAIPKSMMNVFGKGGRSKLESALSR